jgi:hypothetical protein
MGGFNTARSGSCECADVGILPASTDASRIAPKETEEPRVHAIAVLGFDHRRRIVLRLRWHGVCATVTRDGTSLKASCDLRGVVV